MATGATAPEPPILPAFTEPTLKTQLAARLRRPRPNDFTYTGRDKRSNAFEAKRECHFGYQNVANSSRCT